MDFLGKFGCGRGVLSSSQRLRVVGAYGPLEGRLCFSYVFSKGFTISRLRFRLLLISFFVLVRMSDSCFSLLSVSVLFGIVRFSGESFEQFKMLSSSVFQVGVPGRSAILVCINISLEDSGRFLSEESGHLVEPRTSYLPASVLRVCAHV